MPNDDVVEVTRNTVVNFCREFISRPYLAYTEHGQHARFFTQLYNALPPEDRYTCCNAQELCVLQKEYPTSTNLDKSRRQHWDIALIKTPVAAPPRQMAFDYLPLAAVVEFGLNCASDHLEDDIARLCHPEANVDNRFVVHLYRLSRRGEKISGRDWSPESTILCLRESIQVVLRSTQVPIEVFYGIVDETNANPSGLWRIRSDRIDKLA
jgi:hypothetical protein